MPSCSPAGSTRKPRDFDQDSSSSSERPGFAVEWRDCDRAVSSTAVEPLSRGPNRSGTSATPDAKPRSRFPSSGASGGLGPLCGGSPLLDCATRARARRAGAVASALKCSPGWIIPASTAPSVVECLQTLLCLSSLHRPANAPGETPCPAWCQEQSLLTDKSPPCQARA